MRVFAFKSPSTMAATMHRRLSIGGAGSPDFRMTFGGRLTNGRRRYVLMRVLSFVIVSMLIAIVVVGRHCIRPRTGEEDDYSLAYELFSSPFDNDDLRSLDTTLRTVVAVLDRLNVTYWLTAGSLLGSYRHHGRIPWDDDVDLMLDAASKQVVWNALTKLHPQYGLFLSGLLRSPYHWKFYPRRPDDGRPIILKPFRWPFIDLMFFDGNATHVWNESPWFSNERWPRSDIFPLVRRPFDGLWLPAPCKTASVLAVNFDDVDRCASRSWNHVIDLPMLPGSSVSVRCTQLAGRFAFVRRSAGHKTSFNTETLVLGNSTLSTVQIPVP